MSIYYPARAVVDVSAIEDNARRLTQIAPHSQVMAVVKADAYGHGLVPAARAALAGGATWLGVAQCSEALALRAAGITAAQARILTWIYGPDAPLDQLIAADIDISVGSSAMLARVVAAAQATGRTARIQVKIDTGLGRGGVSPLELDAFWEALGTALAAQAVSVVGVWSHLAFADEPGHPVTASQLTVLNAAARHLEGMGVTLEVRHIAASAATLTDPSTHLDLVRPGLALYGMSPVPQVGDAAEFGLRPAMRLEAELILVKRVAAGQGVSYSHRWVTDRATTLGVVPLGYADGIDRHASGLDGLPGGPIVVTSGDAAGYTDGVRGRVCMDQFVIDLGPDSAARAGDTVVLFGDPARGEPPTQLWAEASDTISYEITTRLGPRVPRVYIGRDGQELADASR